MLWTIVVILGILWLLGMVTSYTSSEKLMLNSVEGYIAHKVHGAQEGETAFGSGFVICAILDWAEICRNERGYLKRIKYIPQELLSI